LISITDSTLLGKLYEVLVACKPLIMGAPSEIGDKNSANLMLAK